jgi:catalase
MQIMPFDEARSYRINPFDLTKVWPHGDYPLIDVGTLTLDRNVTDYHTEMEQAAFQPNNTVPGTGLSPDKMLLARGFAYADAHRARLGVNYQQIPVNRPHAPVHNYSKDGAMRVDNVNDREDAVWAADGDMVRAAYAPRRDDDDVSQPRKLINEVMDADARDRLVANVAGHVGACKRPDIIERVFAYWRNIDTTIGDRIEETLDAQDTP